MLSGCEPDYPPYCFVTKDRQADGFAVELLKAVLTAVGRDVTFKTAPWPDLRQELADGRLQALPLVGRTPERESDYDFTFPYLTMHGTIVIRKDSEGIHGPADLKGKQVAVLSGDNAEEYLRRIDVGATLVPKPSFEAALRELSAGKHDAVVIQKLLALQLIQKARLTNLTTAGPPLKDFVQHFCFATRDGDHAMLAVLNEGLSLVMADGTFRALYTKWFSALESLGRTNRRIVVGGDSNCPPYEFLDPNGRPAGFHVDLTRAIARRMGLSVDILLDSWARVRKGLAEGEIDVAQAMYYSPERDKKFDFSPPNAVIQYAIAMRGDTPELSDVKTLAGKHILVMAGDIVEDLAVKQGYGKQLVAVPSQEEALGRLARGEGDCALVAKVPALYWIDKNAWSHLRVSRQPLISSESCYATAHGKDELLSLFSEGLAAIKSTGEFRAIRAKWLAPYEEDRLGATLKTYAAYALALIALLLLLLGGALLWSRALQRQVDERTRSLTAEISERKRTEQEREVTLEFLRIVNATVDKADLLHKAVLFFKKHSGCDAVGIRLREGDDYPYVETSGLPSAFITLENHLCQRDLTGQIVRDSIGNPVIECMCGNVICGRFDPSKPFFTAQGSFWTNNTTELLASTTDADRQARTRNRCNGEGYESVALLPLRMGDVRLGLLQLNNRASGIFSPQAIGLWERLSGYLAVALSQALAQEALRESEARFRSLIEAAPDAIFVQSEGCFIYLNPAMLTLLGANDPSELLGTGIFERTAPESHDAVRERIRLQCETGRAVPLSEQQLVRLDGTRVTVETTAVPTTFKAHKAHLVFVRDITARKQAEGERERLMAAIEQSTEIILITDTEGSIQYVNPAFERATGYTRSEALGKNPRILKSGKQDALYYRALWQTLASGKTWEGRFINKRKDGALYTEEATISPVRDASGSIVNYVAVKRDITAHLLLETQLLQAQKMEAIGRLAGGVAHDFNNMLSVILGTTELAMVETDPALPLFADLQEIRKAAERSAELTRQLLAFARKQAVAPKVLNLNDTVAMMLKMLRRLIGENVELVWEPGAGDTTVKMDPCQLDQILANLAINARDAISGVGKLVIETGNVTFGPAHSDEPTSPQPGDYVLLAVSDSGCGMDKSLLNLIFEPFFTTKDVGEGTGLGLATVYGIVQQNGGFITVASEPGQGTTFKIYLPRQQDKAETSPAEASAEEVSSKHETVLLVEDEPAILQLGRRMLESLGYRVQTASSPEEALLWAASHASDIHLLMTDVIVPQMNGWDLAKQMLLLNPNIRLLFMSGYTSNVIAHREMLSSGAHFIQKPFSRRDLASKLREVLDSR